MTSRFLKLNRRDFLRLAAIGGATLAVPALYLGSKTYSNPAAYQQSADALGTTITIRIEDDVEPAEARTVAENAMNEIRRLETLLTRFPGGTQVYQLDQSGTLETPSAEVLEVLRRAESVSDETGGAST